MATAASGRRRRDRERASDGEAKPRGTTLAWSALSALGGAALLFLGQVAIEEYKASRDASAKAAERQLQQTEQKSRLLDNLFDEYQRLEELPDRAGDYIETGRGGTRSDVLAVVRHFRKVIAYVVSGRLEVAAVGQLYGGRLLYWSGQLERLGSGASPVSQGFSENYRRNYLLLADALESLTEPPGAAEAAAASTVPAPTIAAPVALPNVAVLPRPVRPPDSAVLPSARPVVLPRVFLPGPPPGDPAAPNASGGLSGLAPHTIPAAADPARGPGDPLQRVNEGLVARINAVPATVAEIPVIPAAEGPDAP